MRVPVTVLSLGLAWQTALPGQEGPVMRDQVSGTSVLLQAVSAASNRVAWVSGHRGTFARTEDGGDTWFLGVVPGADTLQFRDVHAVDARTAYLLSAGSGPLSRIYKTVDAGRTWTLQFHNRVLEAFFDCFDFWDPNRGIAFSDAVGGKLVIVRTVDGGRSWNAVPDAGLPPALAGEGGFAASGTCLVTARPAFAWLGTGAGGPARVFRTTDGGDSWSITTAPVVAGTSTSGIMALAFRDREHGIAAGGELRNPNGFTDNVAVTADGGRTWTPAARPPFPGAVYGIAYAGAAHPVVVAVGPAGVAYSSDNARTWHLLREESYWSVGFTASGTGWAVGPSGRVTKLEFR